MGEREYTVKQNPDNPHAYRVSGVGPNQTESMLPHGILELTYPATWTVVIRPTDSSNRLTPNVPKVSEVTPTSFEPSIKELGC